VAIGYKPGYKFCVYSTRDAQNKEIKQKLFEERFSKRTKEDITFICELDNNTVVEVLDYNDGAVIVRVTGTNVVGVLG
jgi:ribosomal protein S11